MATKSYSKHKEYKEYSSSGTVPYTDEQFDMLKSELIPKGSKLETFSNGGTGGGHREYHYEYKEEKHPSGKYDRKDLHTVEEYTIPPKTVPKTSESSSYFYEREERELPAITSGTRTYNYESSTNSTPGYSKVKSSKVTKEVAQNVDELDSLLDDLQKDQERQLYKSGYTSDTAESTSFDYKRGTPAKAPSSGYSTLRREEAWTSSPPPRTRSTELRQEMYREEKTESRVAARASPVPPAPCTHCVHGPTGTLPRSPMSKVTTTVKTYTYEVPAGADPTSIPLPTTPDSNRVVYGSENHLTSTSGCQYCSHCNSRVREYTHHTTASDERTEHSSRMVYPAPSNDTTLLPESRPAPATQGPTTYKYSETSYSAHNSTQRYPANAPVPSTTHLSPSPAPFPRPSTPSAGNQQPPKKLDDLLADFPEARFPTQPDGVVQRKVEVSHESSAARTGTKNVSGPAVYYPPGHTPFQPKETSAAYASAASGGGAYASGRGMYEYESGARSKEKHSERKTAVPVCLPLCCAMPCVIM